MDILKTKKLTVYIQQITTGQWKTGTTPQGPKAHRTAKRTAGIYHSDGQRTWREGGVPRRVRAESLFPQLSGKKVQNFGEFS